MEKFTICFLGILLSFVGANPIIIKRSSPTGEAVVAISSSDPELEKVLALNIPAHASDTISLNPQELLSRSFTLASPGRAAAGTGRSFVSSSSFNPFLLPLINFPINLEGFGYSNITPDNWLKGVEGFYNPTIPGNGNGEVKTVTAINDNGHVYGKVKTITFDNRAKSDA